MKSRRGLLASIVFLLALPLAALWQMLFGAGGEAAIHAAFALGSALMSVAAFDFRTPRWVAWVGSASAGLLAGIFFVQGLSELADHEALTRLAYQWLGQRLEGWLVDSFMAWGVAVLMLERELRARILGIAAMAAVACAKAYALGLAYLGTSLDARAPILKVLWLLPFVWLLFESVQKQETPMAGPP